MGNRYIKQRANERSKQTETPVIKNYNNIKKESLKIVNLGDEKYYLTFNFSCTYDCVITIYLCCSETFNSDPEGMPINLCTSNDVADNPISFKFSAGTKIEFPEKACIIDFNKFNENDITTVKEGEFYPIVIAVETDYQKISQNGTNSMFNNKRQAQITYGKFRRNSRDEVDLLFHKQCFLYK